MRFALGLSCGVVLLITVVASPAGAAVIDVEGPQDSLAGAPTINHCTLRKAIINANDNAATYPQCPAGSGIDEIRIPAFTITFALAGISEEFGLTGDLDIRESVIITGDAAGTVINGAAMDRIFHINPAGTAGVVVTMNNLHITNGRGLGGGGGILINNATLHLNGVTISGCVGSEGDGGAIWTTSGSTLNLTNCTISGNTAAHHAGAIVVDGGTANIKNTTITGNTSGFSNLTGGIRALGTVNLRNTIVAGNAGVNLPNLDGTFTSLGYNIVGNLGTGGGNPTITATTGDQIGVSDALVNLGPLQNNGGPTPTRALLTGSIAIDKGHSSGSTTDQRGLTRPCNDAGIADATGGDGADIGAFEAQPACSNAPPDAIDDSAIVAEDSGANSINVLGNDTDANGDALTISAVTQGAHGAVAITGGGTGVSYTPGANFFGSDSFTYTIGDGNSGIDTATVSITVTNVQDVPNAVDDTATVAEDSGANSISVLGNDNDADLDALSITAVTQGAHGSVSTNGSTVSYAPSANFFGSDSFTYTVSDGQGGSDTATVLMNVTNVNDAPVASINSYNMNQDTTLTVAAPGVLGNDADLDGDTLSAVLVVNVTHGTLVLNPNGSFTYTPNASFAGTDSFTYRANDGTVSSNAATVTITIADTQGPAITAGLAIGSLSPPNHDLVDVGLTLSVTDNSSAVTTQLTVYSDEDDLMQGSGNKSPDSTYVAPATLRLRAERSGGGDGRIYLVLITAQDAAANSSRRCLTAVVPKSQSRSDVQSVTQRAQAAATSCQATGLPPAGFVLVGDGPVVGPKQ